MANFNDLGKQLQDIVLLILNNEDIAKLIYYPENPLSQPPVPDPFSLKNTKIYTFPYTPPVSEESVFLCVILDDFRKADNIYFKWNSIKFTAIIHRNLWEINGNLRAFAIMSEIDEMINMERVQGMGKNWFKRCNYYSYNDLYNGYIIEYSGYDFS